MPHIHGPSAEHTVVIHIPSPYGLPHVLYLCLSYGVTSAELGRILDDIVARLGLGKLGLDTEPGTEPGTELSLASIDF